MTSTTVIISFYKRLDYLQLVLAGLERQSFQNFDVIIGDDGSDQNTVSILNTVLSKLPLKTQHIWHEDKGFRKNKILNQAITRSSGEYIVFIDADCIPHKEFIREHVQTSEKGVVLTGRRVNLSSYLSQLLTPEMIREGYLDSHPFLLFRDGIFGKSKDIEKGMYIRSPMLRKIFNRKKRGLLGCNMSIHKEDILSINGFDERYEAPAIGEDTDLQYRLELNGINVKSLNQMAIQYHLFHPLQIRSPQNLELFEEVKRLKKAYTPYGIEKDNFKRDTE